ncbi:flagellar biosynthesis chaperone FliJ [Pelomonas saccharophila]|uniref:Flagellar biosynthesis chaperone FliJ n=1 Tax=Roseateles saccharophilus TaxID=304 RepID=A0ABU1YGG9_ROSSA|nr:serine kinase [Roseateles saccharophilus]MDR7267947.1 flagellar biosynthesis chaperone FliJ [Roseateles saccharophilus]
MAIAWKLLADVRERHQRSAMQAVGRDQRALRACEARAQEAEQHWLQQQQAKALHWQSTVAAVGEGGCSVAQLRQAGAWSHALDSRIVTAGAAVVQAQAVVAMAEGALDTSRAQLRRASADVEKARQMQQRARAEQRAQQERRQDEATEEASVLLWSAARRA